MTRTIFPGVSEPKLRAIKNETTPSRFLFDVSDKRPLSPISQNGNGLSPDSKRSSSEKQKWSPWKLIGLVFIIGIAGSLYLTHVFQMQNTLQEVQQLRINYERTKLEYLEIKRNYERMTGPAEVYRRAETLGMVTGGEADPVIIVPRAR